MWMLLALAGAGLLGAIAAALFVGVGTMNDLKDGNASRISETRRVNEARRLIEACHLYAADHSGQFPARLVRIFPDYLDVEEMLLDDEDGDLKWDYSPGHTVAESHSRTGTNTPLFWSRHPVRDDGGYVVAYIGGDVFVEKALPEIEDPLKENARTATASAAEAIDPEIAPGTDANARAQGAAADPETATDR